MSEKMFKFDPSQYAEQFAREGWVHIPSGLTDSFYQKMSKQVEENIRTKTMKEFAVGDKQQAMYEFPEGGDYVSEVRETVGAVCGMDPKKVVLSERHVKSYEASAVAEPLAHKDRYATEISFGFSVHVKPGSTLVLYPYDDLEVNPFNTSAQLRSSLSVDRYPEPHLKKHGRRIEIKDNAGDVIMFRGHKIWHLRANPALTTMLYIKCNSFNCDPMNEDPDTPAFRERTLAAAELPDGEIESRVALIGRRVDYFHRHYTRGWKEVPGVVLWGEKHFSLDEHEMLFLRSIDGRRTVGELVRAATEHASRETTLASVRRLARRGVIDLVEG